MNQGGGPVVDEAPKKGRMCLLFNRRQTSTSAMNRDLSILRWSSLMATCSPCHFPFQMVEKNDVLDVRERNSLSVWQEDLRQADLMRHFKGCDGPFGNAQVVTS